MAIQEDDLIRQAQSGDDEAMTILMEKYKSLVRKKARSLFLMGGDQDDLIQEGMIGLYRAICDYNPEKEVAFRTFAELCISRQIYTAIKTSNRLKNQPLNTYISIYAPAFTDEKEESTGVFMIDQELEAAQQNPEDIVIGKEDANYLRNDFFEYLSKMEKTVLSYYLDGLTYQEIAVRMEKSPKSIDNALQRIRGKLLLHMEN